MIDEETRAILKELNSNGDRTNNEHVDDSKKSNEGSNIKRKIDFSITRENGKIINSSKTIPLNSILVNIIGITIGNCSKNGDEFKFNLNVEEDGSINLQMHAPNNKMNNKIVSKIFDIVSDENNMDSKIMKIIHDTASKISSINNWYNIGNKTSKNFWSSPKESKI